MQATNYDHMPTVELESRPSWAEKIDETDLIDISNSQFLEAIFGDVDQEAQPVVISFVEVPSKVDKKAWYGRSRKRAEITQYLFDKGNNYFSVSAFMPGEDGSYARRKKYFYEQRAVMLDDIGTKVPLERISTEPTALIQTSEGNYQAIYMLSEPIRNPDSADQLMKAFIDAELCDPGAGGPTARLARLPCGINAKYNPPFPCRLRYWNPDISYTREELITGLGLQSFLPAQESTKVKRDNYLIILLISDSRDLVFQV